MLREKNYIIIELFILFFGVPIFLALPMLTVIKLITVIISIIYCFVVSKRLKLVSLSSLYYINFKKHWLTILVSFTGIVIATLAFMQFFNPNQLFIVVKRSPLIWIGIILFYSIFSVYPQELLYRSYFFNRYQKLFKNKNYLLLLNIIVFPLAHLFFKNELVLLVTLIGGIFFTLTYYKSKSLLLTSIEHAIYGSWLFTVGMGEMLAFPIPH